jgi:hypothetical protein
MTKSLSRNLFASMIVMQFAAKCIAAKNRIAKKTIIEIITHSNTGFV